ncbi:MAG TPA: hypothetical protein PKJ45_14530 [Rubrivivax sp.]|nr:hypothetical protein [Rubrivivax sp.]
MDYIELGPAPAEESCAQVGDEDYEAESRRECLTYVRQIYRTFPVPPGVNARFLVRSFPHDFGTYREVVVEYQATREALDFVLRVENNVPTQWDAIARYELAWLRSSREHDRVGRVPPRLPADAGFAELLVRFPCSPEAVPCPLGLPAR